MAGPKLGSNFRGSLRSRLKAFFQDNPDEYLTTQDAAIKWQVREPAVRQTVSDMRRRGELGPGPDLRLPVNRRAY